MTYIEIDNMECPMGEIIIKDKEIVDFIPHENSKLFNEFDRTILPVERGNYTIKYIDKYHDEFKLFNAAVLIPNKIKLSFKLSKIEMFKLKWIDEKYWIQKGNNMTWTIGIAIGTALTIYQILR